METYDRIILEVFKNNIGNHVCFDGTGIMSGLKMLKNKADCFKIIGVDENNSYYGQTIICRAYYARNNVLLPRGSFGQACAILTKSEYKNLPTPPWAKRKKIVV